jgi:DNA-binding HxlR family transcriptional regulator
MAALDLLGRRWSLRLLWELRNEPIGARALRERCDGMSSSVLYERLAELRSAGLIDKNHDGAYELSEIGVALAAALVPLDQWSADWAAVLNSR